MTRVLVAVDESEEAVQAGEVAHRLFGADAEYLAVNVSSVRVDLVPSPWTSAGWGAASPVGWGVTWPYRGEVLASAGADVPEESTQAAENTAERVAVRSGLDDAEALGELGDPADAILRAASERRVDVIVLGAQDRSWFDHLIRPSVSKEVVKYAQVPVLIVP